MRRGRAPSRVIHAAVAYSKAGVLQARCGRVEQVAAARVKYRVGGDLRFLVSVEPLLPEHTNTVVCNREPRRSATTVRMPPVMTSR